MPRPRDRLTYRLRQLPPDLTTADLGGFLERVSVDFGPQDGIHVFSLGTSLDIWESRRTKTATLVFKSTPKPLDNDKGVWIVSAHHTEWKWDLVFDVLFDGFTPLNDVDESIHVAEYVMSQSPYVSNIIHAHMKPQAVLLSPELRVIHWAHGSSGARKRILSGYETSCQRMFRPCDRLSMAMTHH